MLLLKNHQSIFFFLLALNTCAQRQMENVDRGVVAMVQENENVMVQWRVLGTDSKNLKFNLYRKSGIEPERKLNRKPLSGSTQFIDQSADLSEENTWYVKSYSNEKEIKEPGSYRLKPNVKPKNYHSISLKYIEGYTPNDTSVADLDGDGEYEIILHQTGISKDNSHSGLSDEPIFQAYKLDGCYDLNQIKNAN